MTQPIILTWASNINDGNWSQYACYFRSVRENSNQSLAVCLTNNIDAEYRKIIEDWGFQIHFKEKPSTGRIFTDRWHHYWSFLSGFDRRTPVFISDSRDVIMQGDPFGFEPRRNVVLSREGFLHKDSPFNMYDQLQVQKANGGISMDYYSWDVVNAGVCKGFCESVRDFCLLMWSNCLVYQNCTDQAVMNFLVSKIKDDKRVFLSDPSADSFCLTGEVFKENFLSFEPSLINGKVCGSGGNPFLVFHQWDRTIFSNHILKSFLK